MSIRVLIVEDEEIAAQAHASYVERIDGFASAGVARSGREALRLLATEDVELVLLDMNLPDGHGLDLLQRIRHEGHLCDVVAVTSARDVAVVKRAVGLGVVQYVLKPFAFAALRAKLEQYAAYRDQLPREGEVDQQEVDQLLTTLRASGSAEHLPKGISPETLQAVIERLRAAQDGLSAAGMAAEAGLARVTARRYLEHLADQGLAERQPRYGRSGRPEVEYRWVRF
jgi:response regulator of citrate/malate metabolism